jgi:hypothetical protein
MMEKIFIAIAIACSLYLNIQIKPQPEVVEAATGYKIEVPQKHQVAILLTI